MSHCFGTPEGAFPPGYLLATGLISFCCGIHIYCFMTTHDTSSGALNTQVHRRPIQPKLSVSRFTTVCRRVLQDYAILENSPKKDMHKVVLFIVSIIRPWGLYPFSLFTLPLGGVRLTAYFR